jgi:hypothetical protein
LVRSGLIGLSAGEGWLSWSAGRGVSNSAGRSEQVK